MTLTLKVRQNFRGFVLQIVDTLLSFARPLRTAIRNIDVRLEMGVRDGMPLRTVMCFVGLRMAISVRDGLWRGEGVELANRQPLSERYIKA